MKETRLQIWEVDPHESCSEGHSPNALQYKPRDFQFPGVGEHLLVFLPPRGVNATETRC